MIHKILGGTGLNVSIIGFGASPLGAEFGAVDPEEARKAVEIAVDRGINYFDVAPYYGRTLAEKRLGEYLKGKRQKITLATKVCRYSIDVLDYSAESVKKSVEESLKRLHTDYLDVLQVHDVEFAKSDQIIQETWPAMQKIKQEGKARFIGITGYPLEVLKKLIGAVDADTVLSYARCNLVDDSMNSILLPAVKSNGIGLINASPLHLRALTETGPPAWHPAPKRLFRAIKKAARLCRREGTSISDLAMQFAFAQEDVHTTLVGMSKSGHVEANIRNVGVPPNEELLSNVMRILRPVSNIYWEEGLPENHDPGAVPRRTSGVEGKAF
jgi:L-galactose dehydrogenase